MEVDKTTVEPGLQLIVGDDVYIVHDGDVIGREGTIAQAFFSQIKTVSRRHAEISKREGRWFVTIPASVANSTMVDGVEAKRDTPMMLAGEHVLKMSEGCVVRLKV